MGRSPSGNPCGDERAPSEPGTLRTLLPTAHNGDLITFAVTVIITNNISVGLTISNNLSMVGPGSDLLTVIGNNRNRAFQVVDGATSSISGLTFYRCAGAINNSAKLTVSNCLFTGWRIAHVGNSAPRIRSDMMRSSARSARAPCPKLEPLLELDNYPSS